MFKAKLIDDRDYYQLRTNQLIFMLLPAIPIAFLVNYYKFPVGILVAAVVLYVSILYVMRKNQKLIQLMTGQTWIEIDPEEIRITAHKSGHQATIGLGDVDKIIISNDFGVPQETIKDISKELVGKPKENFIIVERDHTQQKFDFIIDSYYMTSQLEKIVAHWRNQGYKLETA